MTLGYTDLDQLPLPELLAIVLRERADSPAVNGVMHSFGNIEELMRASVEELTVIKGVGEKKALQLKSGLELGRRLLAAPSTTRPLIKQPEDAARLLVPDMRYLDREQFRVLLLSSKNFVLAMETVSIGSLSSTIVHPREVFRSAIRRSAASMIVAHNHPSGDPTPSQEDITITKRLMESGRIIGIEVFDHLVVGDNRWVSMKQVGLM